MARIVLIVLALVAGFMIAALVLTSFSGSGVHARSAIVLGLIVVATALIIGGIVTRALKSQESRKRAEGGSALRHGLEHFKKPNSELAAWCRKIPGATRNGRITDVHLGELSERRLAVFTNTHVVQTGHATVPVPRTVYALATPHWPHVDISRRGRMRRFIDGILRRQRLELDDPRFNETFSIRTEDEAFAATLLTPELQAFLLEKPKGITWRLDDGFLCMIYPGALRVDRMGASLGRLECFWRLIPDELKSWSPVEPATMDE